MPAINWGVPNENYQAVIAPTDSIKDRQQRGIELPARSAWLCITSPEYSVGTTLSGSDRADKTREQLIQEEKEKTKKNLFQSLRRQAKLDEREKISKEKEKRRKAVAKSRERNSIKNKKTGFKRRKISIQGIEYVAEGGIR